MEGEFLFRGIHTAISAAQSLATNVWAALGIVTGTDGVWPHPGSFGACIPSTGPACFLPFANSVFSRAKIACTCMENRLSSTSHSGEY